MKMGIIFLKYIGKKYFTILITIKLISINIPSDLWYK